MMSKVVDENKEKIGSMCVVLHRERSFHNIDIRILKSALQKYARRAMFSPKGVWCLIELDLFSYLEIQPCLSPKNQLTQNSIRIRSNMINRLIAMMSEDVGPCQSQLPSTLHRLYVQWIQNRREVSSRKVLIEIYHCIANEKIQRIRLLSDLRTVYNLPEGLTENNRLHRQLLEQFQMNELIKIMYERECRGKTKQELYEHILEHLSNKSELAFAYLSLLFQRHDQRLINQQLWPYLIRTSPFPDSTRALAFFYKTLKHKEHYFYLYHAMAFVIYEEKIRKIDQQIHDLTNIDVEKLYEDHFNEQTTIELDAFVFDRHTGATTSRSDFALEGARVSNECKELFIDRYRQMYNEFKILIDKDEEERKQKKKTKRKIQDEEKTTTRKKTKLNTEESLGTAELDAEIIRLGYQLDLKAASFVTEELSTLAHGQRRTGAHKKAVFIGTDYVYKGPYASSRGGDAKKLLNNLYFTRALLTLEEYLNISDQFRSIVDWHSIIKIANIDEYYLKQKSLGKLSNLDDDLEFVTTKVETNVKVLRRGVHVNRLIELEKDQSKFSENEKQIGQACVQHFYLRYLLNIGDSGTWNILVRRDDFKGICGIDFEEIRSERRKKSNDPLMMIMSKVSKRQKLLYGPYTDLIAIFKQKIDLSDQLAKTLSSLFKIDLQKMNERIEDYANSIIKKK